MKTMAYGRYTTALGMSFAITSVLLLAMQQLIATGGLRLADATVFRVTPFVRVEEPSSPVETRQRVQRPPEVERPPETTLPRGSNTGGTVFRGTPISPGPVEPGRITRRMGFSDGDYVPIFKVLPVYPRRALTQGLEGFVIVEFTVTRLGNVRDTRVVESTHSIFEQAAMNAASKFRYKPRVIDGTAVEVKGVRHKISFQLKD